MEVGWGGGGDEGLGWGKGWKGGGGDLADGSAKDVS